jgi:hypothetical protein
MARYTEWPGGYQMDSSQDEDWEADEETDMARQRYEISIAYNDSKGVKRYANQRGNLWLDLETGKGSIDLPPGTALVGGEGYYINVGLPRERDAGGGGARPQRGQQADAGDDINW